MPIKAISEHLNFGDRYPASDSPAPKRSRMVIFAWVFGLSCLASLTYTFIRPPVYQSTATLLIVPPVTSGQEDNPTTTNNHHAAIQRQVLTSHSLLNRVFHHQADLDPKALPPEELWEQNTLEVIPVDDTHMLELRVEGPRRDILPGLINGWIDIYLENHTASRKTSSDSAYTALSQQLQGLEQKIDEKRRELERFRRQYDIVSMERSESQVLARLRGLTDSLNRAREEEAAAEAHLNAINQALAQGKPVIRAQDQAGLANLEQRSVELREQLKGFEQRFTPQYMALDPNIQALMRNLDLVEEKIRIKRREGQQTAVAEAEQTLSSARQRVENLQHQLTDYKQTVQDFTTRFAEHAALQEELAQLESASRQVKERLVQMEVNEREQFPQVEVLERAYLPIEPVRPQYLRDAGIGLGGSLVLGLLAVWGYGFLSRPSQPSPASELRPFLYPIPDPQILSRTAANELPADHPLPALEHQPDRELLEPEVSSLLKAADDATRLLVGLLLSGLTIEEAARLRWQHIDLEKDQIQVPGPTSRTLPIFSPLKDLIGQLIQPDGQAPVWQDEKGNPLSVSDLSALISCAAHDAGLNDPGEITPAVLRHTYLVFLVGQGIRLAELKSIAGHLPPAALAAYTPFSPSGPGLSLDQIDRVHPALRTVQSGQA